MKVHIDSDEWYPVYFLTDELGWQAGQEIEVDEATATRWKETEQAFALIQQEMRIASNAAWAEEQKLKAKPVVDNTPTETKINEIN